MNEKTVPLFVYGTLRNTILKNFKHWGNTETSPMFELYDIRGFPSLVKGTHKVVGDIYFIPTGFVENLDKIEGNGVLYERRLIRVERFPSLVWSYVRTYIPEYEEERKTVVPLNRGNAKCWNTYIDSF